MFGVWVEAVRGWGNSNVVWLIDQPGDRAGRSRSQSADRSIFVLIAAAELPEAT
jgi:hypothetical protein